jgi:hypothetical protein
LTILHSDPVAHIGFGQNVREALSALWARLRSGLMSYQEGNRRIAEVRRLQAMSDAELAERGIARESIVHFVFRDLFGT